MNDEKIIELLFLRQEDALGEITQKYSRLIRSTARGIVADESDVEEIENDVLLSVWNQVPPTRPHHLPSFLCRIARCRSLDRVRYNQRKKRQHSLTVISEELCEIADDDALDDGKSELIRQLINDTLRSLSPDARVLFVRHYFYLESIKELADRFNMKENQVSVKLYRARNKLRTALEKEGLIK